MNLIEPGLAFIEGLALIASPCILPVLPLVLSASADGGKKRPFGIITGFVLAFSLFAIASRKLIEALGIDIDVIKNASLVLLLFFGLVLLSSKLSEKFSKLTQGAANLGGRVSQGGKDGFFSGVLIGALIGLVWTPCAGPILAAVLVQVIRQQSDLQGIFIILSFAIGAGLPMLAIALMGRKILNKFGFFTAHSEALRKAFGVIIILSVGYIAFGAQAQSYFSGETQVSMVKGDSTALIHPLDKPYAAPDFAGIQGWINSNPLVIAQLKGKVVLIDFWTYSCINCVRTLPYITAWDKKYRNQGLVIIGVHSPEFEFEKNIENVRKAVAQRGIEYPVALDNNLDTWQNFKNQYWPAHYLIDRDGNVVYTHFGEGDYDVTENNIRYLLGLKKAEPMAPVSPKFETPGQSPETYLGYGRAVRYVGMPIVKDVDSSYGFPTTLDQDAWSLDGHWAVQSEKILADQAGAALRFHYKAGKVFLVLGTSAGQAIHAHITLNGAEVAANAGKDVAGGEVNVTGNTLYELIDQKDGHEGIVEIKADAPGLEAYAFTFGN